MRFKISIVLSCWIKGNDINMEPWRDLKEAFSVNKCCKPQ